MHVVGEIGLVAGLILLPAVVVVLGGFALSLLEHRYEHARMEDDSSQWAWMIPYSAASAAMILMPVVLAVWSVFSEEQSFGYLISVGIVLGVFVLFGWATRPHDSTHWAHWSQLPGLALTSAVGFLITLSSYLGRQVAGAANVGARSPTRVLATVGVALVAGGLIALIWRRRRLDALPYHKT